MINSPDTAIFLPLNLPTYKKNKINLLKIHLTAVKTLERIEKIKRLKQIKTEKRMLLYRTIQEIKKYHDNFEKTLPKTNELGEYKTKSVETKMRETEINFYQNSRIDDELNKIQDKLKTLKI